MARTSIPTLERVAAELGTDGIRELTMRFMMGVCIGELVTIGVSEVEIRDAFGQALKTALTIRRAGNA